MLIKPNGHKEWQKWQDKFTPGRHDGRKTLSETGFPVRMEVDKFPSTVKEKLRFVLPNWFCVDCSPTSGPVEPNNDQALGVHLAPDDVPEIDLKKGECLLYFVCDSCIQKEIWAVKQKKLIKAPPGATLERAQALVRWDNAINFLRDLHPDDRQHINPRKHHPVK